jgi:hypothetical protein
VQWSSSILHGIKICVGCRVRHGNSGAVVGNWANGLCRQQQAVKARAGPPRKIHGVRGPWNAAIEVLDLVFMVSPDITALGLLKCTQHNTKKLINQVIYSGKSSLLNKVQLLSNYPSAEAVQKHARIRVTRKLMVWRGQILPE